MSNSIEFISSRQNPKIKQAFSLRKPEMRRQTGLFLIEGRRELARAMANGIFLTAIFLEENRLEDFKNEFAGADLPMIYALSSQVFEKVSARENPDGVLGIARQPSTFLPEFLAPNALVVVAERLEKPGNLGALARSMEAAGCDLLILTELLGDVWNPNAIRASQGAIFSLPIAVCSNPEALAFLRQNHVRLFATSPAAKGSYWDGDYCRSTAFVAGNEHDGLSDFWRKNADETVSIPMHGGTSDSLNVNVATTLCLYQALLCRSSRQL